jgi:hypothetical protein
MRKNLLVATLIGLCVMVTACSRGEENKQTNENTPSTAMIQEPSAEQNQAAPAQTAENNAAQQVAPAPVQPEANPVVAAVGDNNPATPDSQTTTPADQGSNISATDNMMTPPADSTQK